MLDVSSPAESATTFDASAFAAAHSRSVSAQAADPELWLGFDRPLTFSGQSGSSELMIAGLEARGWKCRAVQFPALDRTIRLKVIRYLAYAYRVAVGSASLLRIVLRPNAVLHLNLPQSIASFAKMGPAFVLTSILRPSQRRIVSLNGSVFLGWDREQKEARIFRFLLRRASVVTVVGEYQRERLANLGVPRSMIMVMTNTCEFDAVTEAAVRHKHANTRDAVNLLHLSLLIESKGYPEFLEALELLGRTSRARIRAVLCGPLHFSSYCRRFLDPATKESWILDQLAKIEKYDHVEAEWIRGAAGAEKQRLMQEAEIFVFPSSFPVEAQPLVLLEAMANGCAIICSTVGEIPSTVDDDCAISLPNPTTQAVADAIETLVGDPERRLKMGLAARRRFESIFSRPAHIDRWEEIIRGETTYAP
jgi:glycosyltransferase involved in cell wall biosynthesis